MNPETDAERWRTLASSMSLLRDEPDSASLRVHQSHCGVSLAYLEAFAASFKSFSRDAKQYRTSLIMQRLILPSMKTRLWDYIPPQHKGSPQWYVVHAWSGSFHDMVDSLVCLAERDEQGTLLTNRARSDIMCWIDVFALNWGSSSNKDMSEACTAMEETMSAVCAEGGVVFILDRKLAALSRTWCLFELSHALRAFGKTRVHVAIPSGLSVIAVEGLFDIFQGIDVGKSDASQAQDKVDLLSKVRSGWGLQRTNRELVEGLSQALHCRLRWGGRPEDIGTLSILLLKRKELYLLQAQLSSVFQTVTTNLVDEIFRMYDTDGNGTIDEKELIAGLSAAGFSLSAAITIFRRIDTDKSECITFEEFSTYWESDEGKKVTESMQQQKKDDFSVMGLMENLNKMSTYLRDHNLQEHFTLFENLKGEVLFGENMWAQLDPPAIKGDVSQIFCTISEYFKTKDHKSSNQILYDFLMRNIELLAFHPAKLQRQSNEEGQLFSVYMANIARLLRHQGAKYELERDFATCTMIMALEGWQGLQAFGGNIHFVKSARNLMQAKDVDDINHDRIDLANHLLNLVDEKRRKNQMGTAAALLLQQQQLTPSVAKGPPPGCLSKLLMSASFPSLSDFRASQAKAGFPLAPDSTTSPTGQPLQSRSGPSLSSMRRPSSDTSISPFAGTSGSATFRRRTHSTDHASALGSGSGLALLLSMRRTSVELPPIDQAATDDGAPGLPIAKAKTDSLNAVMEEDGINNHHHIPMAGLVHLVGSGRINSNHRSLKMMTDALSGHVGGAATGGRGPAARRATEGFGQQSGLNHASSLGSSLDPQIGNALSQDSSRKAFPTRAGKAAMGGINSQSLDLSSDWLATALKRGSPKLISSSAAEEGRASASGPLAGPTSQSFINQSLCPQRPFSDPPSPLTLTSSGKLPPLQPLSHNKIDNNDTTERY